MLETDWRPCWVVNYIGKLRTAHHCSHDWHSLNTHNRLNYSVCDFSSLALVYFAFLVSLTTSSYCRRLDTTDTKGQKSYKTAKYWKCYHSQQLEYCQFEEFSNFKRLRLLSPEGQVLRRYSTNSATSYWWSTGFSKHTEVGITYNIKINCN
jgi:hypothetical protein